MQFEIATSDLNLHKLLNLIVKHAQKLTGADGSAVNLMEGSDLICRAASGNLSELSGSRRAMNETFAGDAVRANRTINCPDIQSESKYNEPVFRKAAIRSINATCLYADKKIIGVLEISSLRPNAFEQREIETLEFVTGLMAAMIVKAQKLGSTA